MNNWTVIKISQKSQKEPSTLQSKALTGSSYPKTLWVFAQRCLPFLPILNNYKMILHWSYSSPGYKRPSLNPDFKILTSQNLPFPQVYITYISWKITIPPSNIHNGRMDKQSVIYSYPGILFSYKKIKVLVHVTMWINFKNTVLRERGQTEGCILYGSIYMNIQNRWTRRYRKKVSGCQRFWGVEGEWGGAA